MSNAMSLKARIRNIARQKNIPAQVVLQNYMFERLLVRLSASPCKDKFVLKGGMLVAAMVGLDNRATMDLDTTLKNLPLTPDAIRSALEQICAVPSGDTVNFEVGAISPIREDDAYGGYRVALTARFETLAVPLSIDVSTGTTQPFDRAVFAEALRATARHRGTTEQITDVPGILRSIRQSPELRAMWDKYQKQFGYAQNITYEQILDVVQGLVG